MALQGSIESFAVADVLRLLEASAKVGRLVVTGDRGTASVWVDRGSIVAGVPSFGGPPDLDIAETVLDLLRFETGAFVFEADVMCDLPGVAVEIGGAVEGAEAALAEIESLSELIPSPDAVVSMAPSLPGDAVTLDRQAWSALAELSAGITVAELGRRLELDDVALFRRIAQLVDLGVVEVGEAQPFFSRQSDHLVAPARTRQPAGHDEGDDADGPAGDRSTDQAVWDGAIWGIPIDEAVHAHPTDVATADPTGTTSEGLASPAEATPDRGRQPSARSRAPRLVAPRVEADIPEGLEELFGDFDPFAAVEPSADAQAGVAPDDRAGADSTTTDAAADHEQPADAADLARQMAMLSPRAAQAVAAAADDVVQDGAEGDADADGPDVAREHLARFLDSVN